MMNIPALIDVTVNDRRKENKNMTMQEVSERYRIPPNILEEYEKWELCDITEKALYAE